MWTRLQQAQITAYKLDFKYYADFIGSNQGTSTPFIAQYKMQTSEKLLCITQIKIAQHVQAHQHWKSKILTEIQKMQLVGQKWFKTKKSQEITSHK